MNKQPRPVNIVTRLQPEVYAALEAKFQKPHVGNDTSPLQSGYQLGVQAVLRELRVGYVVQTS